MPSVATEIPRLTYRGEVLQHIELMDDSTPVLGDPDALRNRMRTNGYLYFPGLLGRDRVIRARKAFIDHLVKQGACDEEGNIVGTGTRGFEGGRLETVFEDWQPLYDVLYAGPMMAFFRSFFDHEVLHYDYTWTRQVNPGPATMVHCDVVYMGRGTHELYTAWTPFGDNGFDLGGLMVLEGSNRHAGLAKDYFHSDVDAFCENKPDARAWGKAWGTWGALKANAELLRRSLGANRWVTADYKMGDVVIFSCYSVHGGTDNSSRKVRLSSDTRYQRADQAADERWIGEKPVGHGPEGKRGRIC